MGASDTIFLIVIFLFCEWLDFEISGLLDGFNPHLALAALIVVSANIIIRNLRQTNRQESEESKPNNTENDNKPEEK